jgi:hypothetical protein
MTYETEKQLIRLVTADRLYAAASSLDGKLKRLRSGIAKTLAENIKASENPTDFEGVRAYASIQEEESQKARGMKDAIAEFGKKYPKYGTILQGMIEEKRADKKTNLYFGLLDRNKLSSNDYMAVMTTLGFSEHAARGLYPELVASSRKLAAQKDKFEGSILVE